MQVLVNIVEHLQCRAEHSLTSRKAIEPLIPLFDSPISVVQQLAAKLLSHLLLEEHFQKDPVTPKVIAPLIRILSSGIPLLQQRAVKALVSIALTWPNEIAKEGGVIEISKVILQVDPSLPHALWESAASVLSRILQFNSEFYLEVPVAVLVKLLRSGSESTVIGALNALLVLESDDGTSAESMAESGAIKALLELLRSHQCEDIAAALSLAVEVSNLDDFNGSTDDAVYFLQKKLDYLVSSRPTAVNLSDAAIKQIILKAAATTSEARGVFQAYVEASEIMLEDDVASNKAIGTYGAKFIQNHTEKQKLFVLTHYNTGRLATVGYGNALGVIRALNSGGVLERAYCTETRPFNQGYRLTAYELVHEKIPATLIADSAATALMQAGRVDDVVVGADRVA